MVGIRILACFVTAVMIGAGYPGRLAGETISKRYTADSIYLYLDDWDVRSSESKTVNMPRKMFVNTPVDIRVSLMQASPSSVGVRHVDMAFSTNTAVYPGTGAGTTWLETGRVDAREFRYMINTIMPAGSKIELPALDVMFKTRGSYDVEYSIILEDYTSIAEKFVFNVEEK